MTISTEIQNPIKIEKVKVVLNDPISQNQTGSYGIIFGSEDLRLIPDITLNFKNLTEINSFIDILESAKQRMLMLCNQE